MFDMNQIQGSVGNNRSSGSASVRQSRCTASCLGEMHVDDKGLSMWRSLAAGTRRRGAHEVCSSTKSRGRALGGVDVPDRQASLRVVQGPRRQGEAGRTTLRAFQGIQR